MTTQARAAVEGSSRNYPERHTDMPRRGFLRRMGLAGLGTSAVLFGTTTRAAADGAPYCEKACCVLYRCPNMTYDECRNTDPNYIWNCQWSTTYYCACCETGGLKPDYTGGSAYACQHT